MLVTEARVRLYKSIDDSGIVPIDPLVTVLVGQNESGKTAFLEALDKARPVELGTKYNPTEDYPRKALSEYLRRHESAPEVVSTLTYQLTENEITDINKDLGLTLIPSGFTFQRSVKYNNSSTISLTIDETPYIQHIASSIELPSDSSRTAHAAVNLTAVLEVLGRTDLNSEGKAYVEELDKRFADTPTGWGLLQYYVWRKHLEPKLPQCVYFDDYRLLPGKVNIPSLLERRKNARLEESDKTVLALLRMAAIDVEQLVATASYEVSKAHLEAFSNSITDQVFEYWQQNKELDVEFDIRTDPTDQAPYNNGPNLYIRIRNRRHRVTVPFSQRSKGFIWFFSFLVWFDSVREQLGAKNDLILLLDEPGLSLHALAQADLLRYIDDLTRRHQVLYTTHSPFMVHGDRLHQVRTVEDQPSLGTKISANVVASDRKTIFPLQAALGYSIAQNLFISSRNLLVEGPADFLYLRYFSERLEALGRAGLRGDVTIVPVGGLDKLATFVALLGANDLEVVVLHDSKGTPDQRLEDIVREKLIRDRQVLSYGTFVGGTVGTDANVAADIEDLIGMDLYLQAFNAAYARELGGAQVQPHGLPAGDRVVARIERYLTASNIHLRPSGGFNHYRVAMEFASGGTYRPDADTLDCFEALAKAINRLYS